MQWLRKKETSPHWFAAVCGLQMYPAMCLEIVNIELLGIVLSNMTTDFDCEYWYAMF